MKITGVRMHQLFNFGSWIASAIVMVCLSMTDLSSWWWLPLVLQFAFVGGLVAGGFATWRTVRESDERAEEREREERERHFAHAAARIRGTNILPTSDDNKLS